jgi:diguanylate cyclase (GGDEF)-like protein
MWLVVAAAFDGAFVLVGWLMWQLRSTRRRLAIALKALAEQARRDPLTGLRNQLQLDEDLLAAQHRCDRAGYRYGLLHVEIDDFFTLTGRLGHELVDDVLVAVAESLSNAVRANDAVYRTDAGEFVVFLDGQDEHGAELASQRVRAAIEDFELGDREVTISVGSASAKPADNPAWMVRQGERALAAAKEAGRNSATSAGVVVAGTRHD